MKDALLLAFGLIVLKKKLLAAIVLFGLLVLRAALCGSGAGGMSAP